MSIRAIQYNYKKSDAINKVLSLGIYPTAYEINSKIKSNIDNFNLGTPEYNPKLFGEYSKSNTSLLNKMFKSLEADLTTIYRDNADQSNELLLMKEMYDNNIVKLEEELERLYSRIETIKELHNNDYSFFSSVIRFNSLIDCDLYGNIDYNVPRTDCFFNFKKSSISIKEIDDLSSRVDLSNSTVKINNNSNDSYSVITNDINNDFVNIIKTSNSNKDYKFEIEITLKETAIINMLELNVSQSANMDFALFISEDGMSYFEKNSISNSFDTTWSFEPQTVKSFKVVIIKKDFDDYNSLDYEYILSIRNVRAFYKKYLTGATFVSKEINVDFPINKIKAIVKDSQYGNSGINYYVGIKGSNEFVRWVELKNNEFKNLNLLNTEKNVLNQKNLDFGKEVDNGLYSIMKIDNSININSLIIKSGYMQYNAEIIDIKDKDLSTYKINMSDYIRANVLATDCLNCDNNAFTYPVNKLIVLSQYIHSDNTEGAIGKEILLLTPNSQCKLFVNGIDIIPDNYGKYSFKFKVGENKISIVLFSYDADDFKEASVRHNIDLKWKKTDIYASKMKYIGFKNLSTVVSNNDISYYSIYNNDIVIKRNPCNTGNVIKIIGNQQDNWTMNHYIEYQYSTSKSLNTNTFITIRVMAKLNSFDKFVSPKVNEIRLIGV